MTQDIRHHLQHHFGFSQPRPGQEAVIRHLLDGESATVIHCIIRYHSRKPSMYQTIEAICRNGAIEPLEPVSFEEAEHLMILRLPNTVPTPASGRVRGAMKGMLSDVDAFIEAKQDEIAREERLPETHP